MINGRRQWSQDGYIKAYRFAAQAHLGQTVPGTNLPYIMHLSFVSMEVIAALNAEAAHDEDLAVQCALLHDVIEDTEVTYDQVRAEFGTQIADGVLALTKDVTLPKHLQIDDSLCRIKQQPHEVWMVKLADRISNLQPPPAYWTLERIAGYREEAGGIYEALQEASPLLEARLLGKMEEYKAFLG
ncbi:MAG: HD domain-containing protein [Chloroflexota bacterium]